MNGDGPLVDTSVLIEYFEGIDCRESALLDKLLEQGPPPVNCRHYCAGVFARIDRAERVCPC